MGLDRDGRDAHAPCPNQKSTLPAVPPYRSINSRKAKGRWYETCVEQTGGESVPEKAGDEGIGISDDLHRRDDFSSLRRSRLGSHPRLEPHRVAA